jgi:hypothetical protein
MAALALFAVLLAGCGASEQAATTNVGTRQEEPATSTESATTPTTSGTAQQRQLTWGPYAATYTSPNRYRFRVSMTIPRSPDMKVALGAPGTETLTVTHAGWGLTVANVTTEASRAATVLAADAAFNVWGIWRGHDGLHRTGAGFTSPQLGGNGAAVSLAQHQSTTFDVSPSDTAQVYDEIPRAEVKQLEAMYRTRPRYVVLEILGFGLETDTSPEEGGFEKPGICQPDAGPSELVLAFTGAGKQINPFRLCSIFTG